MVQDGRSAVKPQALVGLRVRQAKPHLSRRCDSFPRQGPASQRESSLAPREATTAAKRRQSDRQAATPVKRTSPVTDVEQMPTVSSSGKAPVGVGFGDCAEESAGVAARGMPGNGEVEELGKPTVVSPGE
jgi:hypothetical protein